VIFKLTVTHSRHVGGLDMYVVWGIRNSYKTFVGNFMKKGHLKEREGNGL
jgi:hypothetical protein